jgi:hypothetical protein
MKLRVAHYLRWLFNGLAMFFLLCCIVTAVFWWRSYFAEELIEVIHSAHRVDTVELTGGVFQLTLREEPTNRPPLHFRVLHTFTGEAPFGGWGPQFLHVGPISYNGWPMWTRIRIPLWAMFFTFLLTPFGWYVHFLATQSRPRAGFCSQCGYDLRASPERCPECGTVVTTPPPFS